MQQVRVRWAGCSSLLLLLLCATAANAQNVLLADYAFENTLQPWSGICPTPAYLTDPTATAGTTSYVASQSGFGQALYIASANNNVIST